MKGSKNTDISVKLSSYIHHYIFIIIVAKILDKEDQKSERDEILVVDNPTEELELDEELNLDNEIDITRTLKQKKM